MPRLFVLRHRFAVIKRRLPVISIIVLISIFFALQLPERGESSVVSKDCGACHVLYPEMKKADRRDVPNTLCVSCHSSTSSDSVKVMGNVRVPVVYSTIPPFSPLAGGNFFYLRFGDRKGHNVEGIASPDAKFGGMPPGYDRLSDPSEIGYDPSKPLTCAGSNGCHGNRNVENPFAAIVKSHHASDTPVDGSTTAKSFRYLKINGKKTGVTGIEDKDWKNSSPKKHNEYSASINVLCANCHGNFHSKDVIGKASPWFRHPTDIVLPNKEEYKRYTTYNIDAPVGREVLNQAVSEKVEQGKDIVICLSCHVAHAGLNESALRWDYDALIAGDETKGGCFICHTGK